MEKNLTKGSIYKHIKDIAIPTSTGLIFTTLYNVVDTYFAGQQIGTSALAGITIGFPIYFTMIALSAGVGSGAVALMSIAIGEKNINKYHELGFNAFIISFIISLFIFFSRIDLLPVLFEHVGAKGEELKYGVSYLTVIFSGVIFFTFNSILNAMLNSYGNTKPYRNFLIIGFFLNAILDPLFIMGYFGLPKLGVAGLALATVLVQAFGVFYLGYKVLALPIFEWEIFKKARFKLLLIKEILAQGIPSTLNVTTVALGVFVINYFILKIAPGPTIIGAYGAAMRVEQLALIPTMGLNIAAVTLTGQNYGAKLYDRIYEVRKKTLTIGLLFICGGAILIFPFISDLIGIFVSDTKVIEAGTQYLKIEIFALPTYVILGLFNSVLQGIKKPRWAVYIGLYRQILMPYIVFELLLRYFDWGINSIWIGIVLINWSAVLFTYFYSNYMMNKCLK